MATIEDGFQPTAATLDGHNAMCGGRRRGGAFRSGHLATVGDVTTNERVDAPGQAPMPASP
jgi:hypothetical protein